MGMPFFKRTQGATCFGVVFLTVLFSSLAPAHAAGYDQRAQFAGLMRAEQAVKDGNLAVGSKIAEDVLAAALKADPDEGGDQRMLHSVLGFYASARQWDDWEKVARILLSNAELTATRNGQPDHTSNIRMVVAQGYLTQGRYADADRLIVQIVPAADDAVRATGGTKSYRELESLAQRYSSLGRTPDAQRVKREADRLRALNDAADAKEADGLRTADKIIKGRY